MKRRQGYRKAKLVFEKHSRVEKESLSIIWGVGLRGAECRVRVIILLSVLSEEKPSFIWLFLHCDNFQTRLLL